MPANNGKCPPFPLVDLKLRNGWVLRNVEPDKFRWKPWDDGESGADIIRWQIAQGGASMVQIPEQKK